MAFGLFQATAEVVKLVDTLASGASGGNPVEVQVFSSAPPHIVPYIFITYSIVLAASSTTL